jgi:dihydrofolate reductase
MEGQHGEGDLGWLMPYVPDGLADNARLLGEETDAILLGRGTYHGFAGFWPTQEGEFDPGGRRPRVELELVEAKPYPAGAVSLTHRVSS